MGHFSHPTPSPRRPLSYSGVVHIVHLPQVFFADLSASSVPKDGIYFATEVVYTESLFRGVCAEHSSCVCVCMPPYRRFFSNIFYSTFLLITLGVDALMQQNESEEATQELNCLYSCLLCAVRYGTVRYCPLLYSTECSGPFARLRSTSRICCVSDAALCCIRVWMKMRS